MKAAQLLLVAAMAVPHLAQVARDSSLAICIDTYGLKVEIEPFLKEFTLQQLDMTMKDATATFSDDPLRARLRYLKRVTWYGPPPNSAALLHVYELVLGYEIALNNILLDVALSSYERKADYMDNLEKIETFLGYLVDRLKADRRLKDYPEQLNEKLKLLPRVWSHVPLSTKIKEDIKVFITLHEIMDGLNEFERIFECEKRINEAHGEGGHV